MKEKNKSRRKKHDLLSWLIVITAVCVFVYAGFNLGMIAMKYWKVDHDNAELQKKSVTDGKKRKVKKTFHYDSGALKRKINFSYLKKVNSDIVGWIYIPHTAVDYPILHGSYDGEYLHHNYMKRYSFAGSIFEESVNRTDFSDPNTIIYGHNMKNGSMFAGIRRYTRQQFMDSHPFVYVYLPDGSLNIYSVFSSSVIRTDSPMYQTDIDYGTYIKKIRAIEKTKESIDEKTKSPLLMLSTCSAANSIYRTVVYGRLAENVR